MTARQGGTGQTLERHTAGSQRVHCCKEWMEARISQKTPSRRGCPWNRRGKTETSTVSKGNVQARVRRPVAAAKPNPYGALPPPKK